MANTFEESEQTIHFPPDWWVIKLDEHRYYRRLSGQGLKSVDFLALHNTWGLVLIELKNYHGQEIPEDLKDTMAQKCIDTGRIIITINKYLRKKIYYKIFFQWLKWYAVCTPEWRFWADAEKCLASGNVVQLLDVQQ